MANMDWKQQHMDYERIREQLLLKTQKAEPCLNKKGYVTYELNRFIEGTASDTAHNKNLTRNQSKFLKDLDDCSKGKTVARAIPKSKQLTLFGVGKHCGCNR